MVDFFRRTGLIEGTAYVVSSTAPAAVIRQARILKARLGNLIQICDGVNDQVELQAACLASYNVQCTMGNFYLGASGVGGGNASTFFLDDYTAVRGAGKRRTKLIVGNGVQENAIGVLGKIGVLIEDLEIDANKTGNVETGPMNDGKQNGVYFTGVTYSEVRNCYIHDAIFHGIFNVTGNYNRFANNEIYNNRVRPIHAQGASYNYYGQNYIHGNGTNDAVHVGGLFVIYLGACVSNIIEGNVIKDENLGAGIYVGGTNASVGNVINDNTIVMSDPNVSGIVFNRGVDASGATGTVVTGNTVVAGRHALVVESGTFNDMVITGNYLKGAGGKGILTLGAITNARIAGNYIEGASEEGIYIAFATTRINISNNLIRSNSSYAGVRLKSVTNSTISGNTIYDTKWTIDEVTDGGNSGNIIRDNIEVTVAQSPTMNLQSINVRGNSQYIAPGEMRTASGTLTAGVANAIGFAWNNPTIQDIIIKKVVIEITTGGGTVGSHLDVGIADNATGTNRGTEFFDDLLLNNTQVNDSWVAGDGGTQTKWVVCQDSVSVTDDWIVGQILDANASNLVGRYYIEYVGR